MKWTEQGECFPVLRHLPRSIGRSVFISLPRAVFRFAARKTVPVGKFVLVVLLVLGLVDAAATVILGRKLAAEINALKAKGERLQMSVYTGVEAPESRNGAVLYAQAFQLMQDTSFQHLKKTGGTAYDPGLPPLSSPMPTYKDLTELNGFLHALPQPGEKWRWEQAAQTVQRHAKAMQLAIKAISLPECRFDTYLDADGTPRLEHIEGLDRLINLFAADAIMKAKAGRMDGAIASIESAYRLTESLRDEPWATSQVIRSYRMGKLGGILFQVLQFGRIDESQARRLSGVLSRIDPSSGYAAAMKNQRAHGLFVYERLRDHDITLQDLMYDGEMPQPGLESACCRLVGSRVGRPILYADELEYIRLMNYLVDNAGLSYRELRDKHMEERVPARYALVTAITCPSLLYSRVGIDAGTAQLYLSRIALGVEAYKGRYGSYPVSLSDLRTGLKWDTPKDPFSGRDFAYKCRADSFVLYSVGMNGKDDGGRSERSVPMNQADDVPWDARI